MMKKLLPILALLLFAPLAHGQSYSTGTTKACASSASCATTVGLSFSAGDYAVVVVSHGTTTTCPQSSDTMTDSASIFSFSAASICSPDVNIGIIEAFVAKATGSNASVTFTAGYPASRRTRVLVLKYTGVAGSSATDVTSVTASTGTASLQSNTFTTTLANEVIIQCGQGDTSTTSYTAGSIGTGSGTVRQSQALDGGTTYVAACQDLTVTSIQTGITATMTATSGTVDNFGFVLSLKAPSGVVSHRASVINQ